MSTTSYMQGVTGQTVNYFRPKLKGAYFSLHMAKLRKSTVSNNASASGILDIEPDMRMVPTGVGEK